MKCCFSESDDIMDGAAKICWKKLDCRDSISFNQKSTRIYFLRTLEHREWRAYPYAAAHPSEVKRLAVMDVPIPGLLPPGRPLSWWIIFHQTPDVPEALVEGKEMMDLSWFYHNRAYNPAAITQADINEYVSHYSAPGAKK